MRFFKCLTCGNEIVFLSDVNNVPVCCGQQMKELKANSTDAALEKHVPVVTVNGNNVDVTVGSVIHPMDEPHFIEWVLLETTAGFKVEKLKPGMEPIASFVLGDKEKALRVYEYCNLHGLWVKEL